MSPVGRIGLWLVLLAAPLAANAPPLAAEDAVVRQTPPTAIPSRGVLHLAIDTPASEEITPVPIDGEGHVDRGVVYDFFRIEQLAARAAAAAGRPIDPAAPPPDLLEGRLMVVAYRTSCDGRSATPEGVGLFNADGQPVPTVGAPMVGDLLSHALPGAVIPPGSMGATFGKQYLSGGDTIRITYGESCQGTTYTSPAIVMAVPVVTHQASLPSGTAARGAPTQVRVEAIVAGDGKLRYASMLAGPKDLESAALEAISQWTFQPGRANGVMVPFTFETTFSLRSDSERDSPPSQHVVVQPLERVVGASAARDHLFGPVQVLNPACA
jgi:TonB-like protein